jgi:hypothetical protein
LHFPFANCRVPLAFTRKTQFILSLKAVVSSLLRFGPPETHDLQ